MTGYEIILQIAGCIGYFVGFFTFEDEPAVLHVLLSIMCGLIAAAIAACGILVAVAVLT